jgi:hypothetical protein
VVDEAWIEEHRELLPENFHRDHVLAAVRERWRDSPDIRTMDEIAALVDRYCPTCGCPDTVEAYVTDLLYRDRHRKEWDEKPSQQPTGE